MCRTRGAFFAFVYCCCSLLGGVVVGEKQSEMEQRSRLEFVVELLEIA